MPTLPLDHPEPFAATLGIMLYPGENESEETRARAWTSQYLAKPVQDFLRSGGTLTVEELARLHADCGAPLGNPKLRWRDGVATGQMVDLYVKAAHSDPKLASWEGAQRAVVENARAAGRIVSTSLLEKARLRFRSVAHLWGAFVMRGRALYVDPSVSYDAWQDFQFFLMEAEILLRWGRAFRPPRAKADPPFSGEAWRIPEGWLPPEHLAGWPRTTVSLTLPSELVTHFRKAGRPRKVA